MPETVRYSIRRSLEILVGVCPVAQENALPHYYPHALVLVNARIASIAVFPLLMPMQKIGDP